MQDRTYREAMDSALRRLQATRAGELEYSNGRTLARKPTRTVPGAPEWIRRGIAADLTPGPADR